MGTVVFVVSGLGVPGTVRPSPSIAEAIVDKCPLCGSKVVYLGMKTLECADTSCENGVKPKTNPSWAELLKKSLYRSTEREVNELWTAVQTGEINQENFRIHPRIIKLLKAPVKWTS